MIYRAKGNPLSWDTCTDNLLSECGVLCDREAAERLSRQPHVDGKFIAADQRCRGNTGRNLLSIDNHRIGERRMQKVLQIGENLCHLFGFYIPYIECCCLYAGMLSAHQCLIRPRCHLHRHPSICKEVRGALPHTEALTFLDPL